MQYPVVSFTFVIHELPVSIYTLGAVDGHAVLIPLSQLPDPQQVDDEALRKGLEDLVGQLLPKSIGEQWGDIINAYNNNLPPKLAEPEPSTHEAHVTILTLDRFHSMDSLRPGGTSRTWHFKGDHMLIAAKGKVLDDFLPSAPLAH